jgi:23S rRNA pseudouridine2605 synthase
MENKNYNTNEIRLNKFLSVCGVASRRKADEMIENKQVKVNGIIVSTTGVRINPKKDIVIVDGIEIKQPNLLYYKFNKPTGVVTTASDEKERTTVMDFFADINAGLFPVGRLDKNSEGLIIVTNDGNLANRLTHPKYKVEKVYFVTVNKKLTKLEINKLENGVELAEGVTEKCKIEIITNEKISSEFKIILKQGWNRQIRRMVETIGAKVIRLERIQIGNIIVQGIKPGKKIKLSDKELKSLKQLLKL